MFDTIIVPLNGSPDAEAAIPCAVDEARRHGATLLLVHIIARPELSPSPAHRCGPSPSVPVWPEAEMASAMRETTAYLAGVSQRYALDPGTQAVMPVGDPYLRLVAEIEQRPRPLVVIATGGGAIGQESSLSETARRLLRAGIAPILAVRPPQPQPHYPAPARRSSQEVRHPRMVGAWTSPPVLAEAG